MAAAIHVPAYSRRRRNPMKRVLFFVGLVFCVAIGASAMLVNAAAPATSEPTPATQFPTRYGYAGKIIAVKPPGDWTQSGGPADANPVLSLFQPMALPVFGTDKNIAGGNEVSIASNPTNPLNFLAGANTTGRFTTTDGGQTWNVGSLGLGGDPVTAFDAAGRAYFGSLGNTSSCPDNPYFYRSTDGGFTFTGPMLPITDSAPGEHFFDKEWIAVDNNATSPYFGRIYYTVSNFRTPPGCNLNSYIDVQEQLVFSTDQGTTWSRPPTQINDASHNQAQFTNPVAARDGTLYVGYQYQNCTFNCNGSLPMVNLVAKSSDGGVSFSPSITITGQPISATGAFVGGYQYLYAGSTTSGFRHNDQGILGVSPTNANEVYAMWTDGRWDTSFVYQSVTGQHADIAFSRSTDGGTTWSAPIRVNDDAQANGKDQFFPWMTVGTDGTIHASWSDRRDSATGFQYRQYYSQSTDGGLTWSVNQAVSDVGGTPGSFIGDYSSIAVNANNTLVLPLWTDARSGIRVYTDPGAIPLQDTPTPTTTPPISTNTATSTHPPPPPTSSATSTIGTQTAVATATSTACTITLTDVDESNVFYPFIRCLACRGIIGGYDDGTFRPFNDITRGQIAKIVSNAAGFDEDPGAQIYEDVPVGSPFYQWINRLSMRGHIGGYPCGLLEGEPCIEPDNLPYFRPSNSATRGQLAKIVANAAGLGGTPTGVFYTDVQEDHTFYLWIMRLTELEVMSGYDCGGEGEPCDDQQRPYFRPFNNVTRGQASKIVANTFFPGCQTPSQR
jgi:hypothetical protein